MSCGFRDSCGCGYQFLSSNINIVWKRQIRAGGVLDTGESDVEETDSSTRGIDDFCGYFRRGKSDEYRTICHVPVSLDAWRG